MQYLVPLRLRNSDSPTSPGSGIGFIEELILPTLERCKKLQEDKILAGGYRRDIPILRPAWGLPGDPALLFPQGSHGICPSSTNRGR